MQSSPRVTVRFQWAARAAALAFSCIGVGAAAAPVPVADFFKLPDFTELVMSPSGKRISALVSDADGRMSLAILDLADLSKSKIIAGSKDADVVEPRWVNDDRLVFSLYDRIDVLYRQRGTALMAVDAKGDEAPRLLIRPRWETDITGTRINNRTLPPNHFFESVLRDGSNDVVVSEYVFNNNGDVESVNLKRQDTTTGVVRNISQGAPSGARTWALDWEGNPRVVDAVQGGKEVMYWKATAAAEWTKVRESDLYSGHEPPEPLYVDAKNRLYASARASDKDDNESLLAMAMSEDMSKGRPLLSADGYDIDASLVHDRHGNVLGARYLTDARATFWFDAGMKKIQAQVDTLLPGTTNRLDCGDCENRDKVLVASTSDRQPTVYSLFDTKAGTLAPLVASRGWIKPATMAQRDLLRFDARDGLGIPVHVTRPAGTKTPLPTVVLVHGGPNVRGGEWTWDAESQFLASRGYVVVEPEFRGSTGFGFKHFRAGWKQWGLGMQDDVADAAKWAVRQGFADPKRMCIAGASYGGYATLMGLIRNPEIFRCGFEWVGVTDIDLMYSINWSDFSDEWQLYGMPLLIGDRVKDAAQLAATSPIRLADKVTQPLLMAYGALDRRVPIDHGTQFRDAVRKVNKDVEWVQYPNEGHGWTLVSDNIDFWTRVERFLDKNLKNAP